jgi:hypothetical protein
MKFWHLYIQVLVNQQKQTSSEHHYLLMGLVHAMRSNGPLHQVKTHVLDAGGFGSVKSAEEYGNLVDAASKEWSEIPEAAFEYPVVYAQKPPSLT